MSVTDHTVSSVVQFETWLLIEASIQAKTATAKVAILCAPLTVTPTGAPQKEEPAGSWFFLARVAVRATREPSSNFKVNCSESQWS